MQMQKKRKSTEFVQNQSFLRISVDFAKFSRFCEFSSFSGKLGKSQKITRVTPKSPKKSGAFPPGDGGARAFANSLPEGASALSGSLLKLPASRQAVRLFTPNGRVANVFPPSGAPSPVLPGLAAYRSHRPAPLPRICAVRHSDESSEAQQLRLQFELGTTSFPIVGEGPRGVRLR
jgi:hypothetical protein